jgi:large subunit ribosomal protein L4
MTQLKQKIFNEKLNSAVVHEAHRWYLASRRRGTHSALTRTEVSGGGKKPWAQKGTGNARAGSTRSPLWRHGGVIFPPKPRDYGYALPKRIRKMALRVVLSELNREGKVIALPTVAVAEAKTKAGQKFLKEQGVAGKTIVLLGSPEATTERALRNLAGVSVMTCDDLNIHDLLQAEWLVLDTAALKTLEARLS